MALNEPAKTAGSTMKARYAASGSEFKRAYDIQENDLISINYTSGTTSKPKGVMITHRNAYMNIVGVLIHLPMAPTDRYLWTLPMFHANGWTYVWIVTATSCTHVCLTKSRAHRCISERIEQESITILCAAPTILIGIANAPDEVAPPRPERRARHHCRGAFRRGDDRAY